MTKQDLINALSSTSSSGVCSIEQTYTIDSGIDIPAGITLTSQTGKGVIQATGDFTMLNISGTKPQIKNIKFVAPSNNATVVSNNGNPCDGLLIDNCSSNAPLLNTQGGLSHFTISNTQIIGQNASQGNPAIVAAYVSFGTVFGTKIRNTAHGIQMWGGDSAPANGGATLTTDNHGAANFSLYENDIADVAGGGIVCSMAAAVHAYQNLVARCGDVGVDLEGAIDWLVEHNTVTDCSNGNYTNFFNNARNVFQLNRSVLTGKNGQKHYAVYNGNNPNVNNNLNVTFNSNVWDGPGSIGQDFIGKVITDGKNALLNGAYQAWTGGTTPFPDNGTQDIPAAGYQKKVTPPVVIPPVVTPPVVTPPVNSISVPTPVLHKIMSDLGTLASLVGTIATDVKAIPAK